MKMEPNKKQPIPMMAAFFILLGLVILNPVLAETLTPDFPPSYAPSPAPSSDPSSELESSPPSPNPPIDSPAPSPYVLDESDSPAPSANSPEDSESPAPYVDSPVESVSPAPSSDAPAESESPTPSADSPVESGSPTPSPDASVESGSPVPSADSPEDSESPTSSANPPADSESPANPPADSDSDAPALSPEPSTDEIESPAPSFFSASLNLLNTEEGSSIKDICGKTDFPSLCESAVSPILLTGIKPDPDSALRLAIKAASEKTKEALATMGKLRSGSHSLHDCKDVYDAAVSNLQKAADAIASRDLETLDSMLSAAVADYNTCSIGYEETGVDDPLADVGDMLMKMASNCLGIASLIKQ